MIFKRPLIMASGEKYSTYITRYKKKHYKRMPIDLLPEEYEILTRYCNVRGISRREFVREKINEISYLKLKEKK